MGIFDVNKEEIFQVLFLSRSSAAIITSR